MTEKQKELKRKYFREYYRQNKYRVKQIKRKYVVTHREKVNEIARNWRKNNPDKAKQIRLRSNKKRKESGKDLEYSRKTRLSSPVNGKKICFYRLRKRKYPDNGCCEVCGKQNNKKLGYHHWDDKDLKPNNFVKGIWVCLTCHTIITYFSRKESYDLYKKYLKIKNKIDYDSSDKNGKTL